METPVKPVPISGYRSRAINAVADFADAMRPLSGKGARVTDGPNGKTISVDVGAAAARPRAWTVRAVPTPSASNAVEWMLRVYAGLAALGDTWLAGQDEEGTDEATGLDYYTPPVKTAGNDWLCVATYGTSGDWDFEWHSSPFSPPGSATRWRAIAHVSNDSPPKITQYEAGVIDFDSAPAMLPFDISLLANGHYGVYVGGSGALAVNNGEYTTIMDTQLDADGFADLGASASAAWLYVRVSQLPSGQPEYHWGVASSVPTVSGVLRAVTAWQIGSIVDDEIRQLWRGRIRIADTHPDGGSIERGENKNDLYQLQLRDFSGAGTISPSPSDDMLVRVHGTGGDPNRLEYVSIADLEDWMRGIIGNMIASLVNDLLDPRTGTGADLLAVYSGYFQPLVTVDTTTDGTDSGTYVGILKYGNSIAWQPTT